MSVGARKPLSVGLVSLCVLVGGLAFASAPALAAAPVFKESFNGGAGHEFSDPSGIAVNNATGDIYVVDKGNSRVEEFNSSGSEVLGEFNGAHLAATGSGTLSAATGTADLSAAIGTGDLSAASGMGEYSEKSTKVTVLETSAGAFAAGQEISGPGIPEKTTITKVAGTTVTLSAETTETQILTEIHAGSKLVTAVTTSSPAFAVGQQISGQGVPGGATIAKVDVATKELELSVPAYEAVTGAELDAGSEILTGVHVTSPTGKFEVGQSISGTGIPSGTTITAVGATTLTLSALPETEGTNVELHAGSKLVTGVTTATGAFAKYEQLEATGLPAGTEIVGVNAAGDLELSQPASVAGTPSLTAHESLSEPEAIAVDNSGKTVAEDPSVGDLYVTDHGLVDKFAADGTYLGQITGTCEGAGEVPSRSSSRSCKAFTEFEPLDGVAVDPQGQVWVYQKSFSIDAFSDAAANAFLSSRSANLFPARPGLAVNSKDDLYVDDGGFHSVSELDSSGTVISTSVGPAEGNTGVAVDPSNDDVYIDSGNPEESAPEIEELTPSGSSIATFGKGKLADHGGTALAVSGAGVSGGDVYVVDSGAGKVDIFAPPPKPAGEHTFSTSFGGPGDLSDPSGVAVNESTGDVYVADKGNNRVAYFTASGQYHSEFNGSGNNLNECNAHAVCKAGSGGLANERETGQFSSPSGIAVDNDPESESYGDVYVADTGNNVVDKFTSTGEYVGQITGTCEAAGEVPSPSCKKFAALSLNGGIAVDGNGTVWINQLGFNLFIETPKEELDSGEVDDYSDALINEFSGSRLSRASSTHGEAIGDPALAVDSEDNLYMEHIVQGAKLVAKLNSAGNVLTPPGEEVGGAGATGAAVEASSNDVYVDHGATLGRYTAKGSLIETLGSELLQAGSGVAVSSAGGEVYVADAAADVVDVFPRTVGPGVKEEQAMNVEATAATLEATVDPNGFATSYRFEYDTSPYTSSASHGTSLPVPNAAIGSGTTPVPVRVRLTGLTPGATYYYRVVAQSAPLGVSKEFDGSAKTFVTVAAAGPPPGCANEQLRVEQRYGSGLPDCRAFEMVSPVATGGQDATEPFALEGPRAAVSGEAVTYASRGDFGVSAGDGYENQFVSRRGPGGWSTQEITPPHEPHTGGGVFSSYEPTAFTPELTAGIASTNSQLTAEAPLESEAEYGLYVDDFAASSPYRYVGAVGPGANTEGTSTDLSHVVFARSAREEPVEWVNGAVAPVAVANDGEAMDAKIGSENYNRGPSGGAWQAVSANGSRVYFTSPAYAFGNLTPAALYLRENTERPQSAMETNAKGEEVCVNSADACTVDVSAPQRLLANPAGAQTALYWGASADGSRVFFTSKAELTEDAYTGPAHNPATNLYEYDLQRPAGERLQDLTVDPTDAGGAAVQGVVQISEDGSYVYFVADGVLAEHAQLGKPNLYLSHDGGAPTFIATLAASDISDWAADAQNGYGSSPETNSAVLAPDGTRLAFASYNELTGYDNHDAGTGQPDSEIFLYDAETGRISCASCNPSGARPTGSSSLPGTRNGQALYRPRDLLEDGTLFFDSSDALVPHSSDARQNVYEYENGHVYAISDVAGGYESFFLDASASGDDVFFATADQLLPEDQSSNVVVYDARVDGGFPVRKSPSPCETAEACRTASPPTPSVFGTPPSATFSGPGNVTPAVAPPKKVTKKAVKCKKNFVKNKQGKCVKRKSKKHKAKKSAHTNRRTH